MDPITPSLEARIAELWASFDDCEVGEFIALMDAALGGLPRKHPVALFERGAAQDSTGHSDLAVPLYEAALQAGLSGPRRRRAVIQMSSSLRNLGQAAHAAALLRTELQAVSDDLDGAVRGFLALALVDLGQEREAVAIALGALAATLPRYNRSLAGYARDLVDPATFDGSTAGADEQQMRSAVCAPVQRQLEAYNARDLVRFVAEYAEDVRVFRPPAAEPAITGKQALAEHYAAHRFNRPGLHAKLVSRMTLGNKVIDHERICGVDEAVLEAAAVYEVVDGRIRTVWFFNAG